MNTINHIKQHYFNDHLSVNESPLVILSVVSFTIAGILAFFISGIDGPYATYVFGVGIASFITFTLSHIGFSVFGAFYRNGVVTTIRNTIFFIGILAAVIAIFGFLLFGWVIPLGIGLALIAPYTPAAFTPLVIIGVFALAFTWIGIGLEYIGM